MFHIKLPELKAGATVAKEEAPTAMSMVDLLPTVICHIIRLSSLAHSCKAGIYCSSWLKLRFLLF